MSKFLISCLMLLGTVSLYTPLFISDAPLLVVWNQRLFSPLGISLIHHLLYASWYDRGYLLIMCALPVTALLLCWCPSSPKKRRIRRGVGGFYLLYVSCLSLEPSLPLQTTPETAHKHRSINATWEETLSSLTQRDQVLRIVHQQQESSLLPPNDSAYHTEANFQKTLSHLLQTHFANYQKCLNRLPALSTTYTHYVEAAILAQYEQKHALLSEVAASDTTYQEALQEAAAAQLPLLQAEHFIKKYRAMESQLLYLEKQEAWLAQEQQALRILIPSLHQALPPRLSACCFVLRRLLGVVSLIGTLSLCLGTFLGFAISYLARIMTSQPFLRRYLTSQNAASTPRLPAHYTHMPTKVENVTKPTSQTWISEVMINLLNLNNLSDSNRLTDRGVRHSQKPTFGGMGVYLSLLFHLYNALSLLFLVIRLTTAHSLFLPILLVSLGGAYRISGACYRMVQTAFSHPHVMTHLGFGYSTLHILSCTLLPSLFSALIHHAPYLVCGISAKGLDRGEFDTADSVPLYPKSEV